MTACPHKTDKRFDGPSLEDKLAELEEVSNACLFLRYAIMAPHEYVAGVPSDKNPVHEMMNAIQIEIGRRALERPKGSSNLEKFQVLLQEVIRLERFTNVYQRRIKKQKCTDSEFIKSYVKFNGINMTKIAKGAGISRPAAYKKRNGWTSWYKC